MPASKCSATLWKRSQMLEEYRHSGRVERLFFVLLPISMLLAGGLGTLHGLIEVTGKHRPIGTSLFLVLLLGGAIVAYAHSYLGRCRSRAWALVLALVLGLSATAAVHTTIYLRTTKSLAPRPSFGAWLMQRASSGVAVPGVRGRSLQGTGAWVLWLSEAIGLTVFLFFVAQQVSREPFCERCCRHADRRRRCVELPNPSDALVHGCKVLSSMTELGLTASVPSADPDRWLVLERHSCECGELQTLSLVLESRSGKKSDKGDASEKPFRKSKAPLRSGLIASGDDLRKLDELFATNEKSDGLIARDQANRS